MSDISEVNRLIKLWAKDANAVRPKGGEFAIAIALLIVAQAIGGYHRG